MLRFIQSLFLYCTIIKQYDWKCVPISELNIYYYCELRACNLQLITTVFHLIQLVQKSIKEMDSKNYNLLVFIIITLEYGLIN